jgi:hypothetical protein
MSTVTVRFAVANIDNGIQKPGAIPASATDIATTSTVTYQAAQIIGTTEAAIVAGAATDNCLCAITNQHATATVSVGLVVSATFYPLMTVPPGETAYLPRLSSIAGTYIKSSAASTGVLVTLIKIV